MASNIDTSIPRPGNADTRRLRQQFEVIKREIESLQAGIAEVEKSLAAGLEPSDDAVMKAQLAAIAFSGSYYHLSHRPVIPQDAEDIGALPLSGGTLTGELLLDGDGRTGLNPVTLQQLNNRLAELRNALAMVARTGEYSDLLGLPELGTAAATNASQYATAAQGAKADTATQPGELALVATTLVAGLMAAADKAKLNGIEANATADQTAAEILAALLTVAGAGSGLDADKLDGKQLAALESEYRAYTDTAVSALVDASPETLDTLNELAAALGNDPDFATTVSNQIGTKLNASAYTAADVIAKLLTVHGAGSGLDADKLDGQHAAAFATAAQGAKADTATQPGELSLVATSGAYADLSGTPGNATTLVAGLMAAADKAKLNGIEVNATADQTAAEILQLLLTVAGAGSGLDADKLDGKHATAFALVGHAHDYLPSSGKAVDADKLDGRDASQFQWAKVTDDNGRGKHPGTDWNEPSSAGFYDGSNLDNATPFKTNTWQYVIQASHRYGDRYQFQLAADFNSGGNLSARVKRAGNWDDWYKIWTDKDFDPSDFATTAGVSSVLPPVNASPGAGSTINDFNAVDLDASAFATVGTADQHAAAQWQISTTPDFSDIVYDSGEVTP
jgi:hypothetical protein